MEFANALPRRVSANKNVAASFSLCFSPASLQPALGNVAFDTIVCVRTCIHSTRSSPFPYDDDHHRHRHHSAFMLFVLPLLILLHVCASIACMCVYIGKCESINISGVEWKRKGKAKTASQSAYIFLMIRGCMLFISTWHGTTSVLLYGKKAGKKNWLRTEEGKKKPLSEWNQEAACFVQ